MYTVGTAYKTRCDTEAWYTRRFSSAYSKIMRLRLSVLAISIALAAAATVADAAVLLPQERSIDIGDSKSDATCLAECPHKDDCCSGLDRTDIVSGWGRVCVISHLY